MASHWRSVRGVIGRAEESEDCPICLEQFEVGNGARETPCKHKFHSACLENWLRVDVDRSCPLCRFAIPLEEEGRGLNLGSDVDSVVDMELELDSDSDAFTDMEID